MNCRIDKIVLKKASTHLFVALKYHASKAIGTAVACNVAKDLEIAAVMRDVENAINWVIKNLNFSYIARPILSFSL